VGLVEEGRQEVRGEEGEIKKVTRATAFSEREGFARRECVTANPTSFAILWYGKFACFLADLTMVEWNIVRQH
jgi:hypothetical protein